MGAGRRLDVRSLPAAHDRDCWPKAFTGAQRLDLQGVPEMSAYRELVDLREAFDASQQSIDRNYPGNGEWMARSALCRHLVAVVDAWAREIPADCDQPTDGENTISRLANEAHRLRLENERLRAAINTINCALEALKS